MPRDTYRFQPMTADDLPLVRRWLKTTHVSEWWGDPAEQLTLVSGDIDEPAMDQYIVVKDDRAFAYRPSARDRHTASHHRSRSGQRARRPGL